MGEASSSFDALPSLDIEGNIFPATVIPPGSNKSLFLGGAGVRGLEMEGRFVKFTTIGVYLEEAAVKSLASKWSGKTADELTAALDFYEDIINGSFDKFAKVTMVAPLTGVQYSDKVANNCVNHWKEIGIYTNAEAEAVAEFKEVFKPRNFPPGASLLFAFSASGALSIAFSEGDSMPENCEAVIENKSLCLAVFDSIIGKHGVSPAAKSSLALRLAELLNESHGTAEEAHEC